MVGADAVEVLLAMAVTVTGSAVLLPAAGRLPRVAVGFLAFPVGACTYMLVSLGLLVTVGRVDPRAALVLLGVVGGLCLAAGLVVRAPRWEDAAGALAAALIAAAVAWLAWSLHMTRLTPDSLRYLLGAADFRLADAVMQVHPLDLLKRQFGLQVFHGWAEFTPRAYVASVGPLFGASGVGFFGWVLWDRIAGSERHRWLLVAAAVGFALASNRLLYDFFYINTHVMLATLTFVAVAGVWLAVVDEEPWWALPAGISLAATLLLRPESPLVAVLILVPLAASRAGRVERLLVVVPCWTVAALWYGLTLWRFAPGGDVVSLTAPVFGNMIAILLAGAAVLLGGFGWRRVLELGANALVPAMLGALAIYAVSEPGILVNSASATVRNIIGHGHWNLAWPMLIILGVVAVTTGRVPDGRLWVTPVAGFATLYFLLPYARDGSWRVGPGDSGNRILAHIILVLLAFVVMALAGRDPADHVDGGTPRDA